MAEKGKCPPATQDIAVNIKNRQQAIKTAGYGPLNPKEPNNAFWDKKGKRWDVTSAEAKKQTCGNCVMFVKTPIILDCIEGGLGKEEGNVAWDVVSAGELGYCEAFDFKCASARTCDAWVVGGPITDENKLKEKSIEHQLAKLENVNIVTMEVKDDFEELELPSWGEDYSDEALFEDGISVKSAKLKDPKGGLTAAGRKHFKRTQGANLKPGVKGAADTPEKMRRKGSFLTRFFTNPSGPMIDEKGRATRLALSAAAWGEKVPKNAEDAAALAAKGRRLLERYENTKKKDAFEGVESKVFSEMSEEEKIGKYIDSLDDEEFEKMFPIGGEMNLPEEEKWLFDVAGAFLRRSITNRRKKKRRKDASMDIQTKSKEKDKPAFWDKPYKPKNESSKLTEKQKKAAKARAARAGRSYPNLVDNTWASRQKP